MEDWILNLKCISIRLPRDKLCCQQRTLTHVVPLRFAWGPWLTIQEDLLIYAISLDEKLCALKYVVQKVDSLAIKSFEPVN